jgi:hypothetical protein
VASEQTANRFNQYSLKGERGGSRLFLELHGVQVVAGSNPVAPDHAFFKKTALLLDQAEAVFLFQNLPQQPCGDVRPCVLCQKPESKNKRRRIDLVSLYCLKEFSPDDSRIGS